jgi:hypothetical protein
MIDLKSPYPWQQELWDLEEARVAANGGQLPTQGPGTPPAKMSNLLAVVRMARATPEVWSKFVELNEMLASGVVKQADIDEGISAESAEAVHLCGQFTSWFRIKYAPNESLILYSSCALVLKEMARLGGEMDDESIKAFFRGPFPIEEDV